jgi:hypothetical protein
MAEKVTFDGDNHLIIINSGVTDIDVGSDIYLEWKKWVLEADNSKWLAAFRAFGGDPTTLNQTAPNYYFLINNWKVRVENLTLNINWNLYSDDYDTPYDNINSTILSKNSDIPGIYDVNEYLQDINITLTGMTETLNDIDNNILDMSLDIKHILGLGQSNYRLSNHIYDQEGRLLSVTIKIFYNSIDCNNNINEFASYIMNASYDSNGLLIDYKVVKN